MEAVKVVNMEIEIPEELAAPKHAASAEALTDLQHAISAARARILQQLLPKPSLVCIMRLNMTSPCVLTTLRNPALGWMPSQDKPTVIEFSGNYPILHDALLIGQLFALCARNISWLDVTPGTPLSNQKVYCKPSDANMFLEEYIQGLASALKANQNTPGKDLPHNWTLERELFMLSVGIRAYFDGFVTNYSEAMFNVKLVQVPVSGSFHIPNIYSAHLRASSVEECKQLSDMRALCKGAVKGLKLNRVTNERVVEYDDKLKGPYDAMIARHLSFLLNNINRYFLRNISASSMATSQTERAPATSEKSDKSDKSDKKEENGKRTVENAVSTEISPESACKRPRTLAKRSDDVDFEAFCSDELKFRNDMNEAFINAFKDGESVDIDCVIDGVHFLMHKDVKSAPEADFMRIDPNNVRSSYFTHIGGFSKSQSRCNIVVAPKSERHGQLGWLQKLLPPKVSLSDVAIRIPRLNSDSVEKLDCMLNVISQYHSGAVSGVGPRLYGVVFFQAQQAFDLAPRSSKKPVRRVVPVMIVERIKGKMLFDVPNDDVQVRSVLLSRLFEKMTNVNCYNLDSKEMNIMLKEDRSALVFVDWDSAWSGFLIDKPTKATRGVNFHFYTFNMLLYVQRRLEPSHPSTHARLSIVTDFYTRFRAKNSDFTGSPMMTAEWKGLDEIISDTGGFIGAKTPMNKAMHMAQMFVQRVGIDASREDLYEACSKNLSYEIMKRKIDHFLNTSGVMRYFLKKRSGESLGEVLKSFNNIHLDVNSRTALPLACAREEVEKAIAEKDSVELKSCMGFVKNGARVHGW